MTVHLGADHAGTELKEHLKRVLSAEGYDIQDVSPSRPEGGDDYPDYAFQVAEAVARDREARGILICDTGVGMNVAANKVLGASATLVTSEFAARRSREHNDANILVLGSELTKPSDAVHYALTFLATPFSSAERHVRRLGKITYYDRYREHPRPAERDPV